MTRKSIPGAVVQSKIGTSATKRPTTGSINLNQPIPKKIPQTGGSMAAQPLFKSRNNTKHNISLMLSGAGRTHDNTLFGGLGGSTHRQSQHNASLT